MQLPDLYETDSVKLPIAAGCIKFLVRKIFERKNIELYNERLGEVKFKYDK